MTTLKMETGKRMAQDISSEQSKEQQSKEQRTAYARLQEAFAWIVRLLEAIRRDLHHSARSLRRKPGLVVISALSLGLGIGVNAILYVAISKIYGNQATMDDPKHVVGVELASGNQFSYPDYKDLLQSGTFSDALGFRLMGVNLGPKGGMKRISAMVVTGNYFKVLGVSAAAGRTFSSMEVRPETDPRVAVVTSGFWRDHMGGKPNVIGNTLILNNELFTVIGVLPDSYRSVTGWFDRGVYLPFSRFTLPTIDDRESAGLTVLARLRPDESIQQANQAVMALNARLEREFPNRLRDRDPVVFPAEELQFRGAPAQLLLMNIAWGTAISILLIACVNVTGLLLARATDRQGEMAIRGALGAGRLRIAQAMLVESFLLVMAGAAVGFPLAALLNRLPMPPSMMMLQQALTLDTRILPYAGILIGVATLVCGLMPAVRMMRIDINSQLNQGGRLFLTPRTWLREILVAVQIATTFVLIVAALLCVRSQFRIAHVDFGFDIDHGVVAQFGLAPNQYPGQERVRLAERLTKRIQQIPGVVSVSPADLVPLGGNGLIKSFHPAGRSDIGGIRPDMYSVGPEYFRTLGIQLLKGREFNDFDRAGAPPVAIVNETFARTYFSRLNALDEFVQTADQPDSRVIGVVGDSRIDTIGERPRPVIYYSFAQRPSDLRIHVRSAVPPATLVSAVQQAIRETDGTISVNVQTLHSATNLELTMRRVGMILMGVLGGLGLMLATVGLYGVLSYVAASRAPDVAIRMALGATRNRVRWDMLRRALIVVIPSVAVGAFASFAMMPGLSTFLAGVSPFDPAAFGVTAAIFLLTGVAAAYVPAQKNARLEPMEALRRQ